ncbi:UNVERIFIED_CONTAM: hypothetical protein NCL1_58946 [Trichonephila clavipes]
MKMYPNLDKYKFPEIMKGLPKPVNDEDESAETYEFVADLTMKGIPVSQGVSKGYARVAISLEEASHLKVCLTFSIFLSFKIGNFNFKIQDKTSDNLKFDE